jgi:hypothetical protein
MKTGLPMSVSTKIASIAQSLRTGVLLAMLALGFAGSTFATEGSTAANGFITETKQGTCSNNICEAFFDPVPAGQNLLVTHASCKGIGTGVNGVLAMTLNVKVGDENVGPTTHLTPIRTGSLSNNKVFVSNEKVLHVVKSGQTLRALFFTADSPAPALECTIAGQLLKA